MNSQSFVKGRGGLASSKYTICKDKSEKKSDTSIIDKNDGSRTSSVLAKDGASLQIDKGKENRLSSSTQQNHMDKEKIEEVVLAYMKAINMSWGTALLSNLRSEDSICQGLALN